MPSSKFWMRESWSILKNFTNISNHLKLHRNCKLIIEFEIPWRTNTFYRVSLKSFMKFDNITEAMAGATALVESKLSKPLKKFLKSTILDKNLKEKLAIADAKLGSSIKTKLGINCVHDQTAINELMRGIRQQVLISLHFDFLWHAQYVCLLSICYVI